MGWVWLGWIGLGGLFKILCGLGFVQICVGTVVTYSVFPSDCFHKLLTCNKLIINFIP